MSEAELLARTRGPVGWISLNRPRALNALTLGMCEDVIRALIAWRSDPNISHVLLDHLGDRGFCAGGDVRAAASATPEARRAFFFTEYRLNHLMAIYPKPIVAVMDGVTMGGGVGISAPAPIRIATERTLWAMPETAIGLFPDVGAGWFLSRLPGEVGTWLALTGARLKAADLYALGLATHFVASDRLDALKAALFAGQGLGSVGSAAADPGPAPVDTLRADIDRLFRHDTVEGILAALEAEGSVWAAEQVRILRAMAPVSLKVALRLVRQGRTTASFADEMAVEARLAVRMTDRPDFAEGVRAVLVDKNRAPRWNPDRLETAPRALIDALFAPSPSGLEWSAPEIDQPAAAPAG